MAPARSDNDDESASSSSSSDDEFLTSSGGGGSGGGAAGGEGDREAMIRKKLLESFYGTTSASSAPAAAESPVAVSSADDGASDAAGAEEASGAGVYVGVSVGAGAGAWTASVSSVVVGVGAASSSAPPPPSSEASLSSNAGGAAPSSSSAARYATERDAADDLESPRFSSRTYASRRIRSSPVQSLLEADESLALEIRSLDSTTQTLVYENYSKFIDATDAVRSIGRSVDASESGLARLRLSIERIESGAAAVDTSVRSARDAVAEKIRVRRLLARLDALLRLPSTLRTQIDAGRFRLAARSHTSATAILGRHSAGFESLRSIEVECDGILRGMVQDLREKIMHWSGEVQRRSSPLMHRRKHMLRKDGGADDGGDEDEEGEEEEDFPRPGGEGGSPTVGTPERRKGRRGPPLPPTNVAEIFECAGTLLLFSRDGDGGDGNDNGGEGDGRRHPMQFESGLGAAECKSLTLDACGRLLDRVLDVHSVRMEEEAAEDMGAPPAEGGRGSLQSAPPLPGSHLVPTSFLDGVLEAATLFGLTLAGSPSVAVATASDHPPASLSGAVVARMMTPEDRRLLQEFVSSMFGTFLGHVRMTLLQRSVEGEDRAARLNASAADENGVLLEEERGLADGGPTSGEEADEAAFAEICSALVSLLRSVRELASGLALPEVGLDVESASSLVDQTVEMTESIVRRRVGRKFLDLRSRVVRETLGPFVKEAAAEEEVAAAAEGPDGAGGARVVRVARMASVALSDGMQLADDAVRAVLARDSVLGSPGSPVDPSIVRLAVERNGRKFGMWLAAAMEVLAGLDDPCSRTTLDVRTPVGEDSESDDEAAATAGTVAAVGVTQMPAKPARTASATLEDEIRSSISEYDHIGAAGRDDDDESSDLLFRALSDFDRDASPAARTDLALAVAELCRLAERTVPEGINQSIISSTEEDSRATVKSGGFFESSGPSVTAAMRACQSDVDPDGTLAARFKTAASRALQLYATSRGSEAAAFGCAGVADVARKSAKEAAPPSALPASPSDDAWRVLSVAKATCVDCAAVLGGGPRSGPIPPFPEDDDAGTLLMSGRAPLGGGGGIKGLQLDVERMFTERVPVYHHPSQPMDFDRMAVVATVLRAAFRSMVEASRASYFSAAGYRQMQVDCEFLRHVLTHFVCDDDMADGKNPVTGLCNLLNDVMINAGERCLESECVGVSEYYDEVGGGIVTPLSIARRFMEEQEELGEDGVLPMFVIGDE